MSFQSLFRSNKTDGEWQLRREGSLLWWWAKAIFGTLVWVESRNLYQVLREDFWQSWQVLEDVADEKEEKCSLGSQRREERMASALGKMHWGRGWALLRMLLTAWGVVVVGITPSGVPLRWGRRQTVPRGMQNMRVYLPQGLAVLSLSSAPLRGLQPGFSACYFILHSRASQGGAVQQCDLQIFLFWVTLQVLSVNMDSRMRACFPAHEKMTGQELNLLVLMCSFYGLMGVLFADTVPISVPMEGWAETWAGHGGSSGEKEALRNEPAAALAAKQMALVFCPSWRVSMPMAPFLNIRNFNNKALRL